MNGTVQTHNYHPTNIELCHSQSLQEPEAVPPIQPNVMVPPDRSNELKVIEKEIRIIEMELKKFQKCSKKQTEYSTKFV